MKKIIVLITFLAIIKPFGATAQTSSVDLVRKYVSYFFYSGVTKKQKAEMLKMLSPKYMRTVPNNGRDVKMNNYRFGNYQIHTATKDKVSLYLWGQSSKYVHEISFDLVVENGRTYIKPNKPISKRNYLTAWAREKMFVQVDQKTLKGEGDRNKLVNKTIQEFIAECQTPAWKVKLAKRNATVFKEGIRIINKETGFVMSRMKKEKSYLFFMLCESTDGKPVVVAESTLLPKFFPKASIFKRDGEECAFYNAKFGGMKNATVILGHEKNTVAYLIVYELDREEKK